MPVLGSLIPVARDPLGFLTRTLREHGDITTFRVLAEHTLLVNDPDAIERILLDDHQNFPKARQFWRQVGAVFGQGLLTSEGTLWQRQRRLAAPAFSSRALGFYAEAMVEETEGMLAGWHPGETRDLHHDMMGLTLRIAARTLFGACVEEEVAIIDAALNDLIAEVAARIIRPFLIPDWVPLPGHIRYLRGLRRIEATVTRIIAERRQRPGEARDLLGHLIAAGDETGTMSDRQLRDEVVTFLLAGHETTALALSWTLHLLSRHPRIDAQLAEEVSRVIGSGSIGLADVERLPFANAVITESMRLYPPAWAIGRESREACTLGGYRVRARMPIYILPWVLHRDARYYDDPESFRPERWQGDLARRLPRFAYMPFGGGPRICIGKSFAVMEAVLILSLLVLRFRFVAQDERPLIPQPSITLRPKNGIVARLEPRVNGPVFT